MIARLGCWLLLLLAMTARTHNLICRTTTNFIDGAKITGVSPGDTLFLEAGQREYLRLTNFHGFPDAPIVITNHEGVVRLLTDHYYGLSFHDCSYIKLTGKGYAAEPLGIQILHVAQGSGIGVSDESTEFEIEAVEIANTYSSGILAKSDPQCDRLTTRDNFVMTGLNIHDCYLHDIGEEGMYIGSSFWSGYELICDNKELLVYPHELENVVICRNRIENTGWDAIQVSSARRHCRVYDNYIYHDSYKGVPGQMGGILIGTGTDADCYNNIIINGLGSGIEFFGTGGQKIYNNLIVNAGRDFFPQIASYRKYGIYLADRFTCPDSAFYLYHNTIINPKNDGIRFASEMSRHSRIQNNLIVSPGAYDEYETDDTRFRGVDAFVMLTQPDMDVTVSDNLFLLKMEDARFVNPEQQDFSLSSASCAIDIGVEANVPFDIRYTKRAQGKGPDVGAYEYLAPRTRVNRDRPDDGNQKASVFLLPCFPNPSNRETNICFLLSEERTMDISIVNLLGKNVRVLAHQQTFSPGLHCLTWNGADHTSARVQSGVYWCALVTNGITVSTCFSILR